MNISKLLYRSPLMSMIVRNDDAVNAIEIIDMEREPLQSKINRSSLLYVFSEISMFKNFTTFEVSF